MTDGIRESWSISKKFLKIMSPKGTSNSVHLQLCLSYSSFWDWFLLLDSQPQRPDETYFLFPRLQTRNHPIYSISSLIILINHNILLVLLPKYFPSLCFRLSCSYSGLKHLCCIKMITFCVCLLL